MMKTLTNCYALQASYGYFGLTAAMFRRCEEMSKRGIKTVSLTLDFYDVMYDFEQEARDNKKIHPSVIVRNPYVESAILADNWLLNIGVLYAENSFFTHYNILTNCFEYYKANGYLQGHTIEQRKLVKQMKDKNGNIIQKIYQKDDIESEYCFSQKGLCLTIRNTNIVTNKQINFLVFDYNLFIIKEYKNKYDWSVDWIDSVIEEPENSMIIADGPGSARKLSSLTKQNICKVYVLHHNHMDNNGNLTKRDAWNLNNRHKFDAIVALTEHHRIDLITKFGEKGFYTIPNFTKLTTTNSNIQPQKNHIGFFGQLIERKGVQDAIQVISLLHDRGLKAKLNIFGVTPDLKQLDKTIDYYNKIVQQNNLEEYITFHGYAHNAIEEMLKCQCILFPSNSEAQPMTIIESMSLGIPVIAYDCKYGPRSMIKHNISGMLCDVGDIKSLADNTYMVLSNEAFRKTLSSNAKIQASEFTDSDKIFNKWLNIFQ